MFGDAAFSALCILSAIVAVTSHQHDLGLCSQVFLMHQYCTRDDNGFASNHTAHHHPRVGKAGPRGPPGKSAKVDYSAINDTIDERLRGFNQALAKISRLEDLLTWYKASNGYFYKAFNEAVNYATAKSKCVKEGGILASAGPRDPDVRKDLVILMRNSGSSDFWIGANDISSEGTWVWEDGVRSNSMDWSSSQPDNARNNEDCAHYHAGYGWKVNDVACDASLGFLCEKKHSVF